METTEDKVAFDAMLDEWAQRDAADGYVATPMQAVEPRQPYVPPADDSDIPW